MPFLTGRPFFFKQKKMSEAPLLLFFAEMSTPTRIPGLWFGVCSSFHRGAAWCSWESLTGVICCPSTKHQGPPQAVVFLGL